MSAASKTDEQLKHSRELTDCSPASAAREAAAKRLSYDYDAARRVRADTSCSTATSTVELLALSLLAAVRRVRADYSLLAAARRAATVSWQLLDECELTLAANECA
jgi:hypothetical protein